MSAMFHCQSETEMISLNEFSPFSLVTQGNQTLKIFLKFHHMQRCCYKTGKAGNCTQAPLKANTQSLKILALNVWNSPKTSDG